MDILININGHLLCARLPDAWDMTVYKTDKNFCLHGARILAEEIDSK